MTDARKERLREFAIAALIRSIRTFAQAFLACVPTTAVTIGQVDWITALSTAAVAMILSLVMSVATGLPESGNIWSEDE